MKVVLDTNVLVSGLINHVGTPAQIVNLLLNGRIALLYDTRVLSEYQEVLHRKKFGFRSTDIGPLLDYIKSEGEFVAAEPTDKKFDDSDDRAFYEVAKTGRAKFLVTGNKEHFPRESMVKSPKEFIEIFLAEGEKRSTAAT
jgi:uncharacterized protein